MNMNVNDWKVAVQLPHGDIRWIEDGIVAGLPNEGVVETPELSRKVYEGYQSCVEACGRPVAVIVLVDKLGNQTPEVRAYWQKVMQPDVFCCCALVSQSFFARAISSFLIGLRKPGVPTRIFGELAPAVDWGRQQVRSSPAPIGPPAGLRS